jgi:hypothetical protein
MPEYGAQSLSAAFAAGGIGEFNAWPVARSDKVAGPIAAADKTMQAKATVWRIFVKAFPQRSGTPEQQS